MARNQYSCWRQVLEDSSKTSYLGEPASVVESEPELPLGSVYSEYVYVCVRLTLYVSVMDRGACALLHSIFFVLSGVSTVVRGQSAIATLHCAGSSPIDSLWCTSVDAHDTYGR